MPTADAFEWPQGDPLMEVMWRSVTEALDGNGIQTAGDFDVTSTANANEIQVATGTFFYNGSTHDLSSAETHVLTDGGADDRWDLVYFDTATNSSGVREGTASGSPEPPDVQGDEVPLAYVYVAASETDVSDAEILNWRAPTTLPIDSASLGTGSVGSDEIADGSVANADLSNSSVTVTAGRLLNGGGSVSLGGSTTIDSSTDNMFEGEEGGSVTNGDQGIVVIDSLQDGETVEVYKAALTLGTIAAAPSNLDLELVTFDNAGGFTSQSVLISGDGTTIHDRVSGDPLGSYTNSTGGEQSVGVVVDNQTGSDQEVYALVKGAAPA